MPGTVEEPLLQARKKSFKIVIIHDGPDLKPLAEQRILR